MEVNIARRKFIAALGGAAFAWPLTARGQQPMSVIEFLNGKNSADYTSSVAAFRRGRGRRV